MASGCALTPASAQATASGPGRKIPHREVHGGHPPRAPPKHAVFVFRFFTMQEAHPVCLLGDNQTAFLLASRRNRREAREGCFFCSDGILVLFNALMVATLVGACCGFCAIHVATSVSCPAPFCKPHALPDFMKPPAFQAHPAGPGVVVPPMQRVQVPASANPSSAECCAFPPLVHHTSLLHSHSSARHVQAQRRPLVIVLACVSAVADFGGLHFARDQQGAFGEERQHNFTASASAFRAPQSGHHCRPERIDQSEIVSTYQKTVFYSQSNQNTQSSWLLFVVPFLTRSSATSWDIHLAHLS